MPWRRSRSFTCSASTTEVVLYLAFASLKSPSPLHKPLMSCTCFDGGSNMSSCGMCFFQDLPPNNASNAFARHEELKTTSTPFLLDSAIVPLSRQLLSIDAFVSSMRYVSAWLKLKINDLPCAEPSAM